MTVVLESDADLAPSFDSRQVSHVPSAREVAAQIISASVLVFLPLLIVAYAIIRFWNHGIGWFDLTLATVLYVVTGHGLSIGFHRLFTHKSFVAARWLKITLAICGSMAVEGSLITWVAQHRRHHASTDREGDPHSPLRYGRGSWPLMKGLVFAHVGWFFVPNPSHPERWCPDVIGDPDLLLVSRLAPLWAMLSFAIPFALGWAVTSTLAGALAALLWAGVVRVFVLHHVTWGVNSIAHTFGATPYKTKDNSRNVPVLALMSFGDSWHNAHHAFPTVARHGVDRHQLDSSATLIRAFERLGWATAVRWVDPNRLAVRRLSPLTKAKQLRSSASPDPGISDFGD